MANSRSERKIRRFKREPVRPSNTHVRTKGSLLIIGGHEDKQGEKTILRRLAQHVGGGKLVIAPLASQSPAEMWEQYEALMRGLGVRHVHHLRIEERSDGSSVRAMNALEDATAVFFTGGDQLRITSLIGDTPVYSRIYEIFTEGGLIAGTSAGASVLSDTMMVDGSSSQSPRIKSDLRLAPGLGFASELVIDQHFAERGRIGRLLAVVGQNPRILGIGIDEDTAIELRPSVSFRVVGSGAVTVLNGATVTDSNITDEESDRTLSIVGVTLHVLSQGDRFDIKTRTVRLRPAEEVDREVDAASDGDQSAADD
jgi:cyanophycinase